MAAYIPRFYGQPSYEIPVNISSAPVRFILIGEPSREDLFLGL